MATWKTTITADTEELFYKIIIEKGETVTITVKTENVKRGKNP